jgi:arginine/ornithine transport system ATP-binding protein
MSDHATIPPVNELPLKLETLDVHKRFGAHEVLKGVLLRTRAGDVVGIIGSSGSGKSTFLRCINLLAKPDRGRILLAGEELRLVAGKDGCLQAADASQLQRIRTELAVVFQHFNLRALLSVPGTGVLGASGHADPGARGPHYGCGDPRNGLCA